jgi:hypothetical protein
MVEETIKLPLIVEQIEMKSGFIPVNFITLVKAWSLIISFSIMQFPESSSYFWQAVFKHFLFFIIG